MNRRNSNSAKAKHRRGNGEEAPVTRGPKAVVTALNKSVELIRAMAEPSKPRGRGRPPYDAYAKLARDLAIFAEVYALMEVQGECKKKALGKTADRRRVSLSTVNRSIRAVGDFAEMVRKNSIYVKAKAKKRANNKTKRRN